jgi:hypothetical protein
MFCEDAPLDALRAAVTSTLAGDLESPALAVRFFNRLTLLAFAFARRFEKDDAAAAMA